jgi:hypothetical protein
MRSSLHIDIDIDSMTVDRPMTVRQRAELASALQRELRRMLTDPEAPSTGSRPTARRTPHEQLVHDIAAGVRQQLPALPHLGGGRR